MEGEVQCSHFAMGSAKTPLPAEGVERKQKLFAFLLSLLSTAQM